jgi:hypothetical protein
MAIKSLKLKLSCESCGDTVSVTVDTGMADLEAALADAALSAGWHYDTETGNDMCPECAAGEYDDEAIPDIPDRYEDDGVPDGYTQDWSADNGPDLIMG